MWSIFWTSLLLIIPSVLVIWAKRSEALRTGIESFLKLFWFGKDDGLFDLDKQYTLIVQWFYWGAIPTAVMVLIPTHIIVDAIVGLVFAGVIYVLLRYFVKKYPVNPTSGS